MRSIRRFVVRSVLMFVCLVSIGMVSFNCVCPSSNPDVSPDCPNGTNAASAITITANLSTIRPIGQPIQLKIRGNRGTGEHLCFHPGAQTSFLINIEGTGTKTENVVNLADAGWSIEIQALSGGSQPTVTLTKALTPGTTHTLSITGDSSGTLSATFLN